MLGGAEILTVRNSGGNCQSEDRLGSRVHSKMGSLPRKLFMVLEKSIPSNVREEGDLVQLEVPCPSQVCL